MRGPISVSALLLLFGGCASSGPSPDLSFRVMTFNIRLNLESDGVNAWPHRRDVVADIVRRQGIDLLGVQEALPGQLVDLDERLPELARFGDGRSADRSGEYSAIFYRRDRFELLDQGTFWLSETPEVPGSKGWDAAHERIATWGKLRERRSGRVIFHFNTHLDHIGERARVEGTTLLLRKIDEIAGGAPILLTGDFNATPDSAVYALVIAAGMEDGRAASLCPPLGPESTWNGFRQIEPGRRIDFIFTREGLAVLEHAILPETHASRFPSDHLPVTARLAHDGDLERIPRSCSSGGS